MKTSPTQRTLKWLRDHGYTATVTEHWNQFARRRLDLFGIIDVVALREDETLGVQATSGTNVSARVDKILESDNARHWLRAGNRLLVVGWSKKGKRGQRKTWQPTLREIFIVHGSLAVFEPEPNFTQNRTESEAL